MAATDPFAVAWPASPTVHVPEYIGLIERLGAILLAVSDLELAIAFYRDGLRFAFEGVDTTPPRSAHLKVGALRLTLTEERIKRSRSLSSGVRFTFEVAGVDAFHDALVARGLAPTPPTDAEGMGRSFTIRDPDGTWWAFVESLG